jgi:hypothetical protein
MISSSCWVRGFSTSLTPCKSERLNPSRIGRRSVTEWYIYLNPSYADSLESGLEAEVENGRVARMLIKLGFINERPE